MFGTRPLTPNSAGITGPMNINAVIAHLVEMTPPQRKQFAQMHMDDPMLLSAAKFVDNQIAKQAQSIAAQATGAAPPPVNQQVVAQMAPQPPAPQAAPMPQATPQEVPQDQPMPEESGIAQLPAQNMPSEYAAGGIVAFDGGGPVAGVYAPNTVPPGAFIMGNMWRDPETGKTGYLPGYGPGAGLTGYEGMTMGDLAKKAKEKLENLLVSGAASKQKLAEKRQAEAVAGTPALLNKDAPAYTGPSIPSAARKDDRTKRDPANYAPAEAAPKEKTGIDQLRPEKIPATQAIPPSAAERPAQDLTLDRFMPAGSKRPGESDVEAMNRERLKGAEEALSGFNADLAKRGKAMTEQEARIAVREATSKDRLDTNTNMSLINAGLAMMQSTGKKLAGIAEGAQVGTKQYQAGLREYDNAQEKFDAARDMIEQYRRTEDTMNDKERRALSKDINMTRASGIESLINFRTKIYGEDRADARSMLDMTVKQQEAAADRAARERLQAMSEAGANARAAMQERGAAARANQLPGEVRAVQLLGGGDYEKGLRKMAEIQSDKTGQAYAKLYADHVADSRRVGAEPLSPTDFALQTRAVVSAMSSQGPSVVTTKAPVTTGVLQRP